MEPFRIGLIGFGTIGAFLYKNFIGMQDIEISFVYDSDGRKLDNLPNPIACKEATSISNYSVDLVVEVASHEAVRNFGIEVLRKTNLLVVSVGVLANSVLLMEMMEIANIANTKVFISPGAITGVEIIRMLKHELERVSLVTTKNPKVLGINTSIRTVAFQGNAREACKRFPRSMNVASTLALFGIGYDTTEVEVIADPQLITNNHTITAKGSFGQIMFEFQSPPTISNPQTGILTCLSVYNTVESIRKKEASIYAIEIE